MQLSRFPQGRWRVGLFALPVAVVSFVVNSSAHAEDRIDITTTMYQEVRDGNAGNLTVVHPQFDVGVDIGEHTTLDMGYSADAVSGATAAVYEVDATSSATTFDDLRHEGRLSLGFSGSRSRINFNAGVGSERDYASISFGVGGAVDLPGKNTNLAVGYTHNRDEVCDKENAALTLLERRPLTGFDQCNKKYGLIGEDYIVDPTMGNPQDSTVWRPLSIDTLQGTLTQNLSPSAVMQISTFGQVLSGFQSNPYRRVRVGIGGTDPQESVPDVRGRLAMTARFNFYIKPARGAVHMSLRGYADTWGVKSGTGEMGYSQYAGESLLLRMRARVYQQSAATFFKDAIFYQTDFTAGSYFTGDRELGSVRNILAGIKLSYIKVNEDGSEIWGFLDRLQLNLKADFLYLDEFHTNEAVPGVDLGTQFLNSGPAFVAQFGLLTSY